MKRNAVTVVLGRVARKRTKKYERELDKTEQLEKQVRELKSLNRSLMKQLKKLSKGTLIEDKDDDDWDEPKKKHERCETCGKGILEITVLGKSEFFRCLTCDHRGRVVKK